MRNPFRRGRHRAPGRASSLTDSEWGRQEARFRGLTLNKARRIERIDEEQKRTNRRGWQ